MNDRRSWGELLELLQTEQSRNGMVSRAFMADLSRNTGRPMSEIYGVATFYSFITTRPLGRNVIRICKSVPCYLKHSRMIVESIQKELEITPGETTSDGRFSLELVNCIGACDLAPAMLVNDDVHGHLTPERIPEILKAYI